MGGVIKLTLNSEYIALGQRIAKLRNASHRGIGRADGVVASDSIGMDIDGAYGEIAVALASNKPWTNALLSIEKWLLSRDNLPDVGNMEVKTTRRVSGCLLIQKHSITKAPYVLVLLDEFPVVKIVGWMNGEDVKQPKYWRTNVPRPCYMAPQRDLRPIEELLQETAAHP
jgi:hypothetical protein